MIFKTSEYDTSNGISEASIEHNGETLTWHVKPYNRSSYCNRDLLFNEINQYVADNLDVGVQDKIFSCYKDILFLIEEEMDADIINQKTTQLVAQIYQLLDLEKLEYWVRMVASIRYPTNLDEECNDTDELIRKRTYLRSDYVGLVVLTIAVKPMLVIWGSYMSRMSDLTENAFKEYDALGLLLKTDLVGRSYVVRLRELIEGLLANHQTPLSATLGGLGSEELPEYLLGLSLVRRLTLSSAQAQENQGHLVTQLYRDISKIGDSGSLDKTFDGRIKEKHQSTVEDEDKTSRAESYKEKQTMSDGDRVALSVFASDKERLLSMILRDDTTPAYPDGDQGIPLGKVKKMVWAEIRQTKDLTVTEGQIGIMRWTLARMQEDGTPCISPSIVPALNKEALINSCIGVCKIALWHWGFPELAIILTASPKPLDQGLIGGVEVSKLNKAALTRLIEIYPHHISESTRRALAKDPDGLHQSAKKSNPARVGIESLTEMLLDYKWVVNPNCQLSKLIPVEKELHVPKDLRVQLMHLLLRINNVQ